MLFLRQEVERVLMRFDQTHNLSLGSVLLKGADIASGLCTESLKSLRLHKILIDSSTRFVLGSKRATIQLKINRESDLAK